MYPQYQFLFWWRSVFIPTRDFVYGEVDRNCGKARERYLVVGGWKQLQHLASLLFVASAVGVSAIMLKRAGGLDGASVAVKTAMKKLFRQSRRVVMSRQ